MQAGIAAGHPATAAAGARILADGGSAADAAAAATLTACVSEAIMTGLGGGGFATYYDAARGEVTCLDFFCAVPGLDADRLAGPMEPVEIYFGEVAIDYEIGGPTVGVPGVPAGCGEIHRRWGRLPWPEVVRPSIEVAEVGAALPAAHARALTAVWPAMARGVGVDIYRPSGVLLGAGENLYHPGLSDALMLIATEGPQTCYTGPIGAATVSAVRDCGGALGPDDLAAYVVRVLPVKTSQLAGHRLAGRNDLNRTIATADALRRLPTGPARAVAIADALDNGRQQRYGDTTNISVRDRDGNCCVVTVSLGVGSGVWLESFGIHLNSMLGEGELRQADTRPGERMGSMMCPIVVTDRHSHPVLALGSAGASRIRTALLDTLIGVLIDRLPVQQAIARPRFHVADGVVHAEPDYPEADLAELAAAGYKVNRWAETNHYFGGVSAVGDTGAAGDPRRDGVGILVG